MAPRGNEAEGDLLAWWPESTIFLSPWAGTEVCVSSYIFLIPAMTHEKPTGTGNLDLQFLMSP